MRDGRPHGALSDLTVDWGLAASVTPGDGDEAAVAVSADGTRLYVGTDHTIAVYGVPRDPTVAPTQVASTLMNDGSFVNSIAVAKGGPPYTLWALMWTPDNTSNVIQQVTDDPSGVVRNVGEATLVSTTSNTISVVATGLPDGPVYFGDPSHKAITRYQGEPPLQPSGSIAAGDESEWRWGLDVADDGCVYLTYSQALHALAPGADPILSETRAKQLIGQGGLWGCAVADDIVLVACEDSGGNQYALAVNRHTLELEPLRTPFGLGGGESQAIAAPEDGMRLYKLVSVWPRSWRVEVYAPLTLSGGVPG
jgi:hypothetical protein